LKLNIHHVTHLSEFETFEKKITAVKPFKTLIWRFIVINTLIKRKLHDISSIEYSSAPSLSNQNNFCKKKRNGGNADSEGGFCGGGGE